MPIPKHKKGQPVRAAPLIRKDYILNGFELT